MVFLWKGLPKRYEPISRNDSKGGRTYGKQRYPSVTRIVGQMDKDGIDRWKQYLQDTHGVEEGRAMAKKISEESLSVGTALHEVAEQYLNNDRVCVRNERVGQLFQNMKPELDSIDNIRATEIPLYSKVMGLAGTADCIGEYNGTLSVIDFKNARKKKRKSWIQKYFVQTTCYALMWKELFGEDISQLVIIVSAWDDTCMTYIANPNDYIEKAWELLVEWTKHNA